MIWAAALAMVLAAPLAAMAQDDDEGDLRNRFKKPPEGVTYSPGYQEEVIAVERPISRSVSQPLARFRGLDKISGRVTDIEAQIGIPIIYDRLTIFVEDCRTPPEDEAPDAFAYLRVLDAKSGGREVFAGWMFASSPALSAMDHQRYDLWVLSCAAS